MYRAKAMRQNEFVLFKCAECTNSSKEINEKDVRDRICKICKMYICDFCITEHAEMECFIKNE